MMKVPDTFSVQLNSVYIIDTSVMCIMYEICKVFLNLKQIFTILVAHLKVLNLLANI